MEVEYHSICDELDVLALKVLDLLQNIILERNRFDETLRDGYVNMAKTRYIMGSQSVSMLQVNQADITSNCNIVPEINSLDGLNYHSFSMVNSFGENVGKQGSAKSARLRHIGKDNNDFIGKSDKCSISETAPSEEAVFHTDNKCKDVEDPLKWFGLLVPQSLRVCQSNFRDSISFALRIASMQGELGAICTRYNELMDRKSAFRIA